jgi:hypothetical protein
MRSYFKVYRSPDFRTVASKPLPGWKLDVFALLPAGQTEHKKTVINDYNFLAKGTFGQVITWRGFDGSGADTGESFDALAKANSFWQVLNYATYRNSHIDG